MKELTESEQVEVMQIALTLLQKTNIAPDVLGELDMSDEYGEKLRAKLNKLLNPKPRAVTCNDDQQLYVIPCGDGFTCHGYDVVMSEANAIGAMLGLEPLPAHLRGTVAAYTLHADRVAAYGASPQSKNTWYAPNTCQPVRDILEQYRKNRKHIRIFLGDQKTGTSWLDEHEVIGQVGRSMGPMRVPLLIVKTSDTGGGAILTDCIIRLMDVASGQVLWQHEKFNVPALTIKPVTEPEVLKEGLRFEVVTVNERYARFYTERQADDFIKFLKGDRMRLPIAKKQ